MKLRVKVETVFKFADNSYPIIGKWIGNKNINYVFKNGGIVLENTVLSSLITNYKVNETEIQETVNDEKIIPAYVQYNAVLMTDDEKNEYSTWKENQKQDSKTILLKEAENKYIDIMTAFNKLVESRSGKAVSFNATIQQIEVAMESLTTSQQSFWMSKLQAAIRFIEERGGTWKSIPNKKHII